MLDFLALKFNIYFVNYVLVTSQVVFFILTSFKSKFSCLKLRMWDLAAAEQPDVCCDDKHWLSSAH